MLMQLASCIDSKHASARHVQVHVLKTHVASHTAHVSSRCSLPVARALASFIRHVAKKPYMLSLKPRAESRVGGAAEAILNNTCCWQQ